MVQGPLPVIVIAPTCALPTSAALTKPGEVEDEACGAVQPAGTTTVAADPDGKLLPPTLRKLKVKLLPVVLGTTLVGDTVIVPRPPASVNVADAVSCEDSPVAVAC